ITAFFAFYMILLMFRLRPITTLFPYTTLFRSDKILQHLMSSLLCCVRVCGHFPREGSSAVGWTSVSPRRIRRTEYTPAPLQAKILSRGKCASFHRNRRLGCS